MIGIGTNIVFLIMFIDLILFIRNIQAKDLNGSLWLFPLAIQEIYPFTSMQTTS